VRDLLFHSLSIAVFILPFYILLSLLSHTFLLSHIAIDPQSESPISQRLFIPLPPEPKNRAQMHSAHVFPYFLSPQDPPIRVVKHTLYGLAPPIRSVKSRLYGLTSNLCGISHTFTPIPLQYGPTGSPNSHNMASIEAHSAQHDSKWLFRQPNMASYSPRAY
jgi:hypothetical protein